MAFELNSSVFIYPTDTVWGIGAHYRDELAHQYIKDIKEDQGRKSFSLVFSSFAMLKQYIDIPNDISDELLENFWSMQSSLGLKKSLFRVLIPPWISDNDWVVVRVVENSAITAILNNIKGPISSTSLNIKSQKAICNGSDAYEFLIKIKPQDKTSVFMFNDETVQGSKNSSSIVFYHNRKYQIIREGSKVNKLKSLLDGFGCKLKS